MDRRRYLALVAASAAIAGCNGRPGETPTTESTTSSPSTTTFPSPTEGTPSEETPTPEPSGEQSRVLFLAPDEIAAIKKKLNSRTDPWWSALQQLKRVADNTLDVNARSVVDNGAPQNADGNAHKYGSDAPYQDSDGEFSGEADREDYQAALHMSEWIRDLSLAYTFTEEDKYAKKSIELIHAWFVDPKTRMYPSAENFGPHTKGLKKQNSIEHYITIPAMFYGASLVSGHPYWQELDPDGETKLHKWVEQFLAEMESKGYTGSEKNNIYVWWLLTRGTAAAFVGDTGVLEDVFESWRTDALEQLETRGTLKFERWRTRGLYYSLYGLESLTLTAELARHHGVDLYGYAKYDESAIKSICDYHAKYLGDPEDWPFGEKGGLSDSELTEGASSFELAYSYWQKDAYLDAVEVAGRPLRGSRILGSDTLTHGNRFELDL